MPQITDKENSTDEKEEETNNVQALTPKDFCKKFEGTWTADDGTFVDFAFEEEKPCVLFAIWEAGGYFPGGEIKEVETVSENEYIMTVFSPGPKLPICTMPLRDIPKALKLQTIMTEILPL